VDELTRSRLARRFPGAPQVSAATGQWIDALLAAVAERAPHPEVVVAALVPFTRAALVGRAYRGGTVLPAVHGPDGTLLVPRSARRWKYFTVASASMSSSWAATMSPLSAVGWLRTMT